MLVDTPVGGGRPEVVRASDAMESVNWMGGLFISGSGMESKLVLGMRVRSLSLRRERSVRHDA